MPDIGQLVTAVASVGDELMRKAWLPAIYNMAFEPKRSWFLNRLPRSSKGITGLTVSVPYITRGPHGWRGMTRAGYTPSGAPIASSEGSFTLGCCAAAAVVSYEELTACGLESSKIKDCLRFKADILAKTFPYYLRALLWTSDAAFKAVARQAGTASGSVITIDNDGLWNTVAKDRAKLLEPGMYLQIHDGDGVRLNVPPVQVTAVDRVLGKMTLDDVTNTGENYLYVPTDVGGLDAPGMTNFPGILNVIDNDNTFQGVDRSANSWAQAVVTSASSAKPSYTLLSAFFSDCFDPKEAFTHPDIIRIYYNDEVDSKVRYSATGMEYKDGFRRIVVDRTELVGDWDCDRDKIIVPDFEDGGLRIADLGAVENLFGKGWQQVSGRPFMEYVVAYWARLIATDTRKMGVMTSLVLA